jgi:hypothetical protein
MFAFGAVTGQEPAADRPVEGAAAANVAPLNPQATPTKTNARVALATTVLNVHRSGAFRAR